MTYHSVIKGKPRDSARRVTLEAYARRTLRERRRTLIACRDAAASAAQAHLEEREPDVPDHAAHVTAAADLERVSDSERAQLAMVIAALARLDEGTWGTCLACGARIPARRLRTVPEAARCMTCTNQH